MPVRNNYIYMILLSLEERQAGADTGFRKDECMGAGNLPILKHGAFMSTDKMHGYRALEYSSKEPRRIEIYLIL